MSHQETSEKYFQFKKLSIIEHYIIDINKQNDKVNERW